MPLTSITPVYGTSDCIYSDGSRVTWRSSHEEFWVTPSPCRNGTGKSAVGQYEFYTSRGAYLKGELHSGYWWGNVGDRRFVDTSCRGNINGYYPHSSLPDMSSMSLLAKSNAYNSALTKFYDAVKNSELSVATSIGEGRETLVMLHGIAKAVSNPLGELVKAARKIKNTRNRRGSTITGLSTVGSLYLYWHVGLEPFLRDLEAFRSHELVREPNISFAVKGRSSKTCDYSVGTWSLNDSHRYEIGAVVTVSDTHAFENWRAGLSLRPSVAWELVTLSFVVDYVAQIGNYVASLEASLLNNGFSLANGYITYGMRRSGSAKYVRSGGDQSDGGALGGWTHFVTGPGFGDAYGYQSRKSRSRFSDAPQPSMPVLKIPMASQQLLTVASLLSQILNRR